MARKRHQKQAGTAGATKQSGATHSSQENQDDGVTQGTSPGEIQKNGDGNLDIYADISATINGDDRLGLHVHEGQTGDQLPEDVDGDKKEGQAGDGDKKDEDTNPNSQAHDAHDKNVRSDSDKNNNSDVASSTNGEDRPELQNHEGQAGDQPQTQVSREKQDDGVQQGLPPRENHEGQASDQLPGEDENNVDNNVEGDNNDGDGAVPLAPNISPNLTQRTSTRYWVSP
jgi:hypothetical protein